MQLDSIEAATMIVHHGFGVSIVPRRSVKKLLRLPVKILPFGEPPLCRTLGLVQAQGSPMNQLCNVGFEQLVKVCAHGRQAEAADDGGAAVGQRLKTSNCWRCKRRSSAPTERKAAPQFVL